MAAIKLATVAAMWIDFNRRSPNPRQRIKLRAFGHMPSKYSSIVQQIRREISGGRLTVPQCPTTVRGHSPVLDVQLWAIAWLTVVFVITSGVIGHIDHSVGKERSYRYRGL